MNKKSQEDILKIDIFLCNKNYTIHQISEIYLQSISTVLHYDYYLIYKIL